MTDYVCNPICGFARQGPSYAGPRPVFAPHPYGWRLRKQVEEHILNEASWQLCPFLRPQGVNPINDILNRLLGYTRFEKEFTL